MIKRFLKSMGYDEGQIRVLSHTESFIYYTLNQKKELWTNDVALFDFNSEHFTYKKLSIARNKQPNIISVNVITKLPYLAWKNPIIAIVI